MTETECRRALYRAQVSYWLTPEGKLHVEAPPEALTSELRAAIREHREFLTFLCRGGVHIWGRGCEPWMQPGGDDAR